MRNYFKKPIIIIVAIALIFPQLAMADGMMIPPQDYWIQETDQRAVIFHDKGIETMVLSVAFEGDADDFGWIVPVPGKPIVEKGSNELFTSLEELTGYTSNYNSRSPYIGAMYEEDVSGVTVIETKKIDYYDVTILSSTDKDSLTEWLKERDYNFPSSASYILNSYIENEWYFVAMRINTENLDWSDIGEKLRQGRATPVAISFEAKNLVYPLKISSVIGQEDNINSDSTGAKYRTGQADKALRLFSNDTLFFSADNVVSNEAGAVSLWFRPDWDAYYESNFELFTVIDGEGNLALEFDVLWDAVTREQYLELSAFGKGRRSWRSEDINVSENIWHHAAVSWKQDGQPVLYFGGQQLDLASIEDTLEAAATLENTAFVANDFTGGTAYIGRGDLTEIAVDELAVFSQQRSSKEILSDYAKIYSGQGITADAMTTLLAHFDSSLSDEVSSTDISYTKGASTSVDLMEEADYYDYDYVYIELYVFADHKKNLPGFSTEWANWVKKKNIRDMALNDQGDPWISPSNSKYYLTKLSNSMQYSEMNEDLFFRDADDNKKVGVGASDWDRIRQDLGPILLFGVMFFSIVLIASLFSPFGLLFIIGAFFQFFSRKRKIYIAFWIVQSIAMAFYVAMVLILLLIPITGSDTLMEIAADGPFYSVSSEVRQAIGWTIVLLPILVVIGAMVFVMIWQTRRHRKINDIAPPPAPVVKSVNKIARKNNKKNY
ncbi:DUF2330 domain-containing protein [Patescibacteria group bacterium]|nr:DUF2330 domain-containing protein [Patescibacteria group bacterium]